MRSEILHRAAAAAAAAENRDYLRSILPFLPLSLSSSSSFSWPAAVLEALRSLESGPTDSRVDSGDVLYLAISDLRDSISRDRYHPLAASAADGFSLFFDKENKIKCLYYFERIFSRMPSGYVAFERKVLPMEQNTVPVTYPSVDFWGKSTILLCHFFGLQVSFIEDHSEESLEVDFANEYLGGGALYMGYNEAIEIIGAERYASTFRFSDDYVNQRGMDSLGRLKTRIIAIDALCWPGSRQYELNCLLREVNKAFCGFLDHSKYKHRQILVQDNKQSRVRLADNGEGENNVPADQIMDDEGDVGVATGNRGCGAFGGDSELKCIIQWLAALQVTELILSHKWTVDLPKPNQKPTCSDYPKDFGTCEDDQNRKRCSCNQAETSNQSSPSIRGFQEMSSVSRVLPLCQGRIQIAAGRYHVHLSET
ncbi:Poly(ADP-ribose) glycohydrolase 1-like protein [Drosera capensis]